MIMLLRKEQIQFLFFLEALKTHFICSWKASIKEIKYFLQNNFSKKKNNNNNNNNNEK